MEPIAASACPSEQLPVASSKSELETGIKPKLPGPSSIFKIETKLPNACTDLKLEAGMKPKLPDPCTAFKLEHGVKPKPPDPSTTIRINLEAGVVKPPDACSESNLEAGIKTNKLPDPCAKIKPKPEPCEEEDAPLLPPPAWDAAADDCEITPVSGDNPFFTTVMSRSQVQKQFQLTIPLRFQRHLPEARVPAVLLCRGRSWTTSYCGDLKVKKLDAAWRDFAVDNRLRVGDACVFELMGGAGGGNSDSEKQVVFRVQVLRGDLPEEVISKGATSDEPMVILDD